MHRPTRLSPFPIAFAIPLSISLLGALPAGAQTVTGLTLIDAESDVPLGPLTDGATINLMTSPTTQLNVRADTEPDVVGSVRFALNGDPAYATENVAPYALAGDDGGDYAPWTPSLGTHSLVVTAYTEPDAGGSVGSPLAITFTVVDEPGPIAPVVDPGPDVHVALPSSTVLLQGTAYDPDGNVASYQWTQVGGPPADLAGADTPVVTISSLTGGEYVFRLTATDDDALDGSADTRIFVYEPGGDAGTVSGELRTWHRVSVEFQGSPLSESGSPNPFRDLRLDVTFSHPDGTYYTVPGHYAADGNAAETSAESGSTWRAHFVPDRTGTWTYVASFRHGPDIAIAPSPASGVPVAFDGATGSFTVEETDKTGRDHRAKGRLEYVGEHYLRFARTGEYFLKGGADSPENFLGYFEFDDTVDQGGSPNDLIDGLHRYEPHVSDWQSGDPTWQGGEGKGIIGALNYLAGKGMNSVYFLTMNLEGDGREVYPWISPTRFDRFDCSKLDQWEIVFQHMDRLGILLHVLTQEEENDALLDGGALGVERKLYYRELISRFGHHLALTWNLGEENTNTHAQRRAFANNIRDVDPYDHPIVVHTFPVEADAIYGALLGFWNFDGPSLQIDPEDAHAEAVYWRERSAAADHRWVVTLDEIVPAGSGVLPDAFDPDHDPIRKRALWGNLMGGGGGCEWYFGYDYPHSDLDCEDWRSRENMWDQTRHALTFFRDHVPFWQMEPSDDRVGESAHCLALVGHVYVIYLPDGGTTDLDVSGVTGSFTVEWYDPLTGGPLQTGSVGAFDGDGIRSIGFPPEETSRDWVALVTNTSIVPVASPEVPDAGLRLLPARPNPSSGSVRLPFVTSGRGEVALRVFDVAGRLVRTLVDVTLPGGPHVAMWDGSDDTGRPTVAGVYWARLETASGARAIRFLRVE